MTDSTSGSDTRFNDLDAYLAAQAAVIADATPRLDWLDGDLSDTIASGSECADQFRRILQVSSLSRIRVLLHDDSYFWRRCQRIASLLNIYGHVFEIRLVGEAQRGDEQRFLLSPACALRRFHPDALRGEASTSGRVMAQCRQHFDALWERAEPTREGRRLGI